MQRADESEVAVRARAVITQDQRSPRLSGQRLARRSEEAARYIQRLIFDGKLLPGERVPQAEVAEVLGISRMPVRQALIALQHGGWVTIEIHRGAFVSVLDELAVRDHFDLAGIVYGLAVQRAMSRGRASFTQKVLEIAASVCSTSPPRAFQEVVASFHDNVVSATRSRGVEVAVRALSGFVPDNFVALVPEAMEAERSALTLIAHAIGRRSADEAAEWYKELFRRRADHVVAVLHDRRSLPAAASSRQDVQSLAPPRAW